MASPDVILPDQRTAHRDRSGEAAPALEADREIFKNIFPTETQDEY